MLDIIVIANQTRCHEVKKQLISSWLFVDKRAKEAIIGANAGLIDIPKLYVLLVLSP